MTRRKKVIVLGSTGSIGRQSLEVIQEQSEHFELVGLSAHRNLNLLLEQAKNSDCRHLCLTDSSVAKEITPQVGQKDPTKWYFGPQEMLDLVRKSECDIVINAVTGAAGLSATMLSVELGKELAIANKESLVMAGELILELANASGAKVSPIDSEHSALAQCLRSGEREEVKKLHLTASGGPFRTLTKQELEGVSKDQALRHPTWQMGPKITIDSASLMNKALEFIEAHVLFDLPPEQIDVVVHPQSIVHSLVEFCDGSWIAHMGQTDMRIPIQYALSEPKRLPRQQEFSLAKIARLDFEELRHDCFPSIQFAIEACNRGPSARIALNAANEVAVELFLKNKIRFLDIFNIFEKALEEHKNQSVSKLEEIIALDHKTREGIIRWD